jgi:hypothetical protein
MGYRNNAGWLGCWLIYVCSETLRNTLAGSKIVDFMCRNVTVHAILYEKRLSTYNWMVYAVRIRPPAFATNCEDTLSRPHATTTPYNPSLPRRATTTHVTTQVKTPRSPIALYSKSLKCNLGIFLIFFLIRLRYRPFSIGEIISHVLRPLALEPEIALSLFAYLPCILYRPFFH